MLVLLRVTLVNWCVSFPDQGETANSTPADTLCNKDMTRETLSVSKMIS